MSRPVATILPKVGWLNLSKSCSRAQRSQIWHAAQKCGATAPTTFSRRSSRLVRSLLGMLKSSIVLDVHMLVSRVEKLRGSKVLQQCTSGRVTRFLIHIHSLLRLLMLLWSSISRFRASLINHLVKKNVRAFDRT
jgi:hypothetical protein